MGTLDCFLLLRRQYTEVFHYFTMIKYLPRRESVLLKVGLRLLSASVLGSHSYPVRNLDSTFNCCTEKQPCVTPNNKRIRFFLWLKRPMTIALSSLRADFFGADIFWVNKVWESLCVAGALGFAFQKVFYFPGMLSATSSEHWWSLK